MFAATLKICYACLTVYVREVNTVSISYALSQKQRLFKVDNLPIHVSVFIVDKLTYLPGRGCENSTVETKRM